VQSEGGREGVHACAKGGRERGTEGPASPRSAKADLHLSASSLASGGERKGERHANAAAAVRDMSVACEGVGVQTCA
jgi:hypothetical protein